MRIFIVFLMAMGVAHVPLHAQLPLITNQTAGRAVWTGGNVTFTVGVSGTGPFTYQWLLNATNLPNGIITTVAGGGVSDGGAATNANLTPVSMVVDADGNLFVADQGNSRVRKVNTNGIITTVAGNGSSGYLGDGGSATNASLYGITGITVDSSGNLFIADTANQRIRKVSTNGVITTVAGSGTFAYSGDGSVATNASLNFPLDVAVDASGNLFIVDEGNNRIREVSTNGIITTVVGSGSPGYSGDGGVATNANLYHPCGVAVDASGNLFIADEGNYVIRKVSTNGIITTVAGNGSPGYTGNGGAATNASILASGVALDVSGNLFIAAGYNVIREVDTNGIIMTVAGKISPGYSGDGGAATNANLNDSSGVAVDSSGNLFIVDEGNSRIRKVNANGIIITVAGNGLAYFSGDGGPAINASLNPSGGVAVDGSGNFFFADYSYNCVRKVSTNGIITTVAGNGVQGFSGDGGKATNASLNYPFGVAVDVSGNLFIADAQNNMIRKVSTNGIIATVAGNGVQSFSGDGGKATNASLFRPTGVAVDVSGNLFIADTVNSRIRKVNASGVITTVVGHVFGYSGDGGAATNAGLNDPFGMAWDSFGNLYIADRHNNRIREVSTNGIITTVAGSGSPGYSGDGGAATNANLYYPCSVAVDASGNLFIADQYNNRVRKVSANGIIATMAGDGTNKYAGDGGVAVNAALAYPQGVAVGTSGNLFISDAANQRIREVTNIQGPVLALTNVTAASVGDYQVVVTGPGGSVTSSVVNLIVTASPIIYQAGCNSNGSMTLNFVCQPGSTNVVLCVTNLTPPVVWQPLSTNVAGQDGNWQYTDTSTVNCQAKFYRSLTQ